MHSREKTHEILSLRAGSLTFSDVTSTMLVTVSERLLFIVPAHQNRPLQILEIPLIANMEYDKSNGTFLAQDTLEGKAELRLHLRNTGFYILNGFKSAIDVVNLGFGTHNDCDAFCHALVISLQNMPTGLQTSTGGQSDEDKGGKGPRPKKQSRAVMIDLSQDDIISGDTQPFSYPLQAFGRISTSLHIDMSGSTYSSMSPMSPLCEIAEEEAVPLQPGEDDIGGLPDTQQVQPEPIQNSEREPQANLDNVEKAEVVDKVGTKADTKELPAESVATAYPESTSQDSEVEYIASGPLPQQILQRDLVETNIGTPVPTSNLQNLALDALQHTLESPISAAAAPTILPEAGSRSSTAAQFTTSSPRPLPSSALANSGKRMAPKPDSTKQTVSTTLNKPRKQNEGSERETSRDLLQRPRAADAVSSEGGAVDWDEDLRADQEADKDQGYPPKTAKVGASRGAGRGPKKSAGTKTVPKPPALRKKGLKKAKVKENKTQSATASTTLATTRPRRTAASVSYHEQSEQEGGSQGSIIETKETAGHAGLDPSSPNTNNVYTHRKTISLDKQNVGDAPGSPLTGPHQPVIPPEVVVEVSGSIEALSTAVKPIMKPETRYAERDAPEPDRASTCDQEGKPDHKIPELLKNLEVEAVDDSHPMDKKQRADAINRARKSFGSALLDVMNESGMQPIQALHIEPARTKPFGDKTAFVDSVKSALKQGSRKPRAQAPGSGKRKHVQTPTISKQGTGSEPQRTPPRDIQQSARTSKSFQTPRKGSPLHQQIEGGEATTLPPQTADAVTLRADSDGQQVPAEVLSSPDRTKSGSHRTQPRGDHTQENYTRATLSGFSPSIARPELLAKADNPAQILPSNSPPWIVRLEPSAEADNQAPTLSPKSPATIAKPKSSTNAGSPAPISPSNSPFSTAQRKSPAKADILAPALQPVSIAAITHNNGRKRGPLLESEKPQQAKKARKSDPGPVRGQMNDGWVQEPSLASQQVDNAPSHGPTTKSRISEPTAGMPSKAKPNDERPWMQHKSKPSRTSGMRMRLSGAKASESPLKLTQAKAETPRRHGIVQNPSRLTDDHLHRKVQIVGFSAKGPRNQGVSSADKREHDLEQSSSMPTETGKHLAFKNLHTDSTAAEKPVKGAPIPFALFGSRPKRQVEFSLSDQESTDDGMHVVEESGEDAIPAPAIVDVEVGKNASQNSKVDVNGSPRLIVQETLGGSQQSNDVSVLEISGDVDEHVDTISVFESPQSEGLESHNSTDFGLKTAVSNYTAVNARVIAKMKNSRARPSIGVGNLLDHSFPHANKSIKTNAFKTWNLSVTTKASGLSNSSNQFDHSRDPDGKVVHQGLPHETISVPHDEALLFDIEQLNVSVADEQFGSAASARVRRLRSRTPPSPHGEAPEANDSPPSFSTRLGKMIMPPPPRKEPTRLDAGREYESELYMRREQSAMIDAETTLVNGEASEAETNLSSPQAQQRSCPSSSSDEEGVPVSASQKVPIQAINNDRRMWNQKVSQTQQTIKEMLEQVSQVSALI
jgi:hypothetical protein